MALVDDPREMILRMFQLQAREGFAAECESFPQGSVSPSARQSEPIYGVFRQKHFFSGESIVSSTRRGEVLVRWGELRSAKVIYRGRRDVLVIIGSDETIIEIDLSSPTGRRPAMRIAQLVEALGKRWSEGMVTGLPLMSIEAFFAATARDDDFAVNLVPHPPLGDFRRCFETLAGRPDVSDVRIILSDPEEEGNVYAEAIGIVTAVSPAAWASSLLALGAQAPLAADANTRRKLGLKDDQMAWVVAWP
jgi:hypothetical protein